MFICISPVARYWLPLCPCSPRGHQEAPVFLDLVLPLTPILNTTPDYLIVLLDRPSYPLLKDCITSTSLNLSKPIRFPIIPWTNFTKTPPRSPLSKFATFCFPWIETPNTTCSTPKLPPVSSWWLLGTFLLERQKKPATKCNFFKKFTS